MDFHFDSVPFSCLTEEQRQFLLKNLDTAYFVKGEFLQKKDVPQKSVYVIIKGKVVTSLLPDKSRDLEGREFIENDCLGGSAILSGDSAVYCKAVEETLCHQFDEKCFLKLISENESFADYFRGRLKERRKLRNLEHTPSEMTGFMLTEVGKLSLNQPIVFEDNPSIRETIHKMREVESDCILIKKNDEFGMITRTDLLNAVAADDNALNKETAIYASTPLETVSKDDFLFQALIKMISKNIARVVVTEEGKTVGILELAELLGQLSHKSHLLALRIAKCESLEKLIETASEINKEILVLAGQNASAKLIAELASALNGRLMKKVVELIFPKEFENQYCLLTLGSEGRGEQMLKTDQDNALILSDNHQIPEKQIETCAETFIRTLLKCGYPPCKGQVMINNPLWRGTESEWRQRISDWQRNPEGENFMNLAIAFDAHSTAGNGQLCVSFKEQLSHISKRSSFLSHFAAPIFNFASPLGLLGGFKSNSGNMDLKKTGIFPLVHGVRALSVEAGLKQTNTFERINALKKSALINQSMAADLDDSLEFFLKIRLNRQLDERNEKNELENRDLININALSRLERSLLHDAFQITNDFKSFLALRYHIDV